MTRMNEKVSVVSKAHLAFKLSNFWLNAFRDGDGQEKRMCVKSGIHFVGRRSLIPLPYCFQLLLILLFLLALVNKKFRIFWYLI